MMAARRPYVRSMDGWWRRNPVYLRYMLREATSVFVALYALLLLYGLYTLTLGAAAFEAWLASLRHPLYLVFHLFAFAAAVLHALTWFHVAPKAMPVIYIGARRVADRSVVVAQFLIFALITALLLGVALGGGGS